MEFKWREFLQQLSKELLGFENNALPVGMSLPRETVDSQWLGYLGATQEAIALAEARLGKRLPNSYQAFLTTSNGWHQASPFIWRLLPVEEITWYHTRYQDVIDAYRDASVDDPPLSDEDYLIYGKDQREWLFRVEYLQTALQVSEDADTGVYLLNPQIVTPEGEWEAWFLSSALGAVRYRSFQDLMQEEYYRLIKMKKQ